ncbi:hypothetical protein EG329_007172 [Mollisiaceae sp. DMI_Dod_QoI]|nr:hypothetical protein EG329_007172 [Helotiales sp. DMI_Dod_QoI]
MLSVPSCLRNKKGVSAAANPPGRDLVVETVVGVVEQREMEKGEREIGVGMAARFSTTAPALSTTRTRTFTKESQDTPMDFVFTRTICLP